MPKIFSKKCITKITCLAVVLSLSVCCYSKLIEAESFPNVTKVTVQSEKGEPVLTEADGYSAYLITITGTTAAGTKTVTIALPEGESGLAYAKLALEGKTSPFESFFVNAIGDLGKQATPKLGTPTPLALPKVFESKSPTPSLSQGLSQTMVVPNVIGPTNPPTDIPGTATATVPVVNATPTSCGSVASEYVGAAPPMPPCGKGGDCPPNQKICDGKCISIYQDRHCCSDRGQVACPDGRCVNSLNECGGGCTGGQIVCEGECRPTNQCCPDPNKPYCASQQSCESIGECCPSGQYWCEITWSCIPDDQDCEDPDCPEGYYRCADECVSNDSDCCPKNSKYCAGTHSCIDEAERCCPEEQVWCEASRSCIPDGQKCCESDELSCNGECIPNTRPCCEDGEVFCSTLNACIDLPEEPECPGGQHACSNLPEPICVANTQDCCEHDQKPCENCGVLTCISKNSECESEGGVTPTPTSSPTPTIPPSNNFIVQFVDTDGNQVNDPSIIGLYGMEVRVFKPNSTVQVDEVPLNSSKSISIAESDQVTATVSFAKSGNPVQDEINLARLRFPYCVKKERKEDKDRLLKVINERGRTDDEGLLNDSQKILPREDATSYYMECAFGQIKNTETAIAVAQLVPERDLTFVNAYPLEEDTIPDWRTTPVPAPIDEAKLLFHEQVRDRGKELQSEGRFRVFASGEGSEPTACPVTYRMLTYEELFPNGPAPSLDGMAYLWAWYGDRQVTTWLTTPELAPALYFAQKVPDRQAAGWRLYTGQNGAPLYAYRICIPIARYAVYDETTLEKKFAEFVSLDRNPTSLKNPIYCSQAIRKMFDRFPALERSRFAHTFRRFVFHSAHEFNNGDCGIGDSNYHPEFPFEGRIDERVDGSLKLYFPEEGVRKLIGTGSLTEKNWMMSRFARYFLETVVPEIYSSIDGSPLPQSLTVIKTLLANTANPSIEYNAAVRLAEIPFNCKQVWTADTLSVLASGWCYGNWIISLIPFLGQVHDAVVLAGDIATGIEANGGAQVTYTTAGVTMAGLAANFLPTGIGTITTQSKRAIGFFKNFRAARYAAAAKIRRDVATMEAQGLRGVAALAKNTAEDNYWVVAKANLPTTSSRILDEAANPLARAFGSLERAILDDAIDLVEAPAGSRFMSEGLVDLHLWTDSVMPEVVQRQFGLLGIGWRRVDLKPGVVAYEPQSMFSNLYSRQIQRLSNLGIKEFFVGKWGGSLPKAATWTGRGRVVVSPVNSIRVARAKDLFDVIPIADAIHEIGVHAYIRGALGKGYLSPGHATKNNLGVLAQLRPLPYSSSEGLGPYGTYTGMNEVLAQFTHPKIYLRFACNNGLPRNQVDKALRFTARRLQKVGNLLEAEDRTLGVLLSSEKEVSFWDLRKFKTTDPSQRPTHWKSIAELLEVNPQIVVARVTHPEAPGFVFTAPVSISTGPSINVSEAQLGLRKLTLKNSAAIRDARAEFDKLIVRRSDNTEPKEGLFWINTSEAGPKEIKIRSTAGPTEFMEARRQLRKIVRALQPLVSRIN